MKITPVLVLYCISTFTNVYIHRNDIFEQTSSALRGKCDENRFSSHTVSDSAKRDLLKTTINRSFPGKTKLKPIVCIYTSIDFNTHNKQIFYDHVEYISAPRTGSTNKHAFYKYLEVPTVKVTFYTDTSVYQSRKTSCNEGKIINQTHSIWSKCILYQNVSNISFCFFTWILRNVSRSKFDGHSTNWGSFFTK